jgi:catechol 2,3-dioxygenase-like lactoylglutathione lyase family enzyme
MAFHHVAIATRNLEASHRFYTEAMGFQLVRVEAMPYAESGWARHVFYDTGNGEMFAIWDLNGNDVPDFDPAISTGLGLPSFVNHIAFDAAFDELDAKRDRWLDNGHDVVRIDHGWCTSVYANDPNGIMVEFCATTRAFTADDHREALELLNAATPPLNQTEPPIEFFEARSRDNAGVS